jgi:ketosteroid isomerase-like protein
MRRAFIALAFAALLHIQAAGQGKTAVMATVQGFVDAFNRGDTKTATALCAEQTFIIDEFPPYEWRGTGGCAKWMTAYDADAKKNAITDGVVTLSSARHVDIVGDRAYVVVPVDYAFKQKGKPVKETASILTVVLRKSVAGWRVSAWSWSKN